jgi:hypothetical protein
MNFNIKSLPSVTSIGDIIRAMEEKGLARKFCSLHLCIYEDRCPDCELRRAAELERLKTHPNPLDNAQQRFDLLHFGSEATGQ